jgi:hypothetical protein
MKGERRDTEREGVVRERIEKGWREEGWHDEKLEKIDGGRSAMRDKCNTIFSITVQTGNILKCTGYNRKK